MAFTDLFLTQPLRLRDLDDAELMQRTLRGDRDAFRELYDRHRNRVFMYGLRMLHNREASLDLVQEVFMRVHTSRERFQPGSNFSAWLLRITRNLCLNVLRNRATQGDRELLDEEMIELADSSNELAMDLAGEVANLPPNYREALVLREYHGMSYQEIADATGQSLSNIKFRIFKAREILRRRLGGSLDKKDKK